MDIINYSMCQCGAITLYTEDSNYSVLRKNLKQFINIDLRNYKSKMLPKTYCCNHCVNHFGLDLCGCGSGEYFGLCENQYEECKVPMQILGEYNYVKGIGAF